MIFGDLGKHYTGTSDSDISHCSSTIKIKKKENKKLKRQYRTKKKSSLSKEKFKSIQIPAEK